MTLTLYFLICRVDIKRLADSSLSEKKNKILNWLYSEEFDERQQELRKSRAENSGKWFLKTDEFINWLEGKETNCLFAVGIRIHSC